ncbi:MAG: efflux RND transporter periplasmic adaptor subunit [Acetobacteraceae bacterium]
MAGRSAHQAPGFRDAWWNDLAAAIAAATGEKDRRRSALRLAALVAAVLAALALALAWAPGAVARTPAPAVTVAPVVVKNVAPVRSYIGRVVAIQSVRIVPRVTAFIDSVPVKEGSDVKAGQVLIELQKTQYEAALQSARAQLASARAGVAQAKLAYERAKRLNKQGFEAASALDQATATYQKDQASVLSAEANLTEAGLNLGYCTITSPITGRIGAVTMTKGNLVTPSTPPLATVNQLDPIRVVFSIPERSVVKAEQKMGASQSSIVASLAVSLKLSDGSAYASPGRIAFQSNEVDPSTGTVSVYADFPNPDALLLPGAYVSVELTRARPEMHPLVPVQAVQTDSGGSFVLLVGPDHKVKQQPITLGAQIAQNYIVEKGLSGGESVIVTGVQKVRPGEAVSAVPAAPTPAASGTSG